MDKNAGAVLPYDLLILATGLIDITLQDFEPEKLMSYGIAKRYPFIAKEERKFIDGVYSIDDPFLYQHFKKKGGTGSPIDLLTRKKRPQTIAVYGRSLHTFGFINGLLSRGVDPKRILLIIPPKMYEAKDKFASNEERLEYINQCVADADPFEDQRIEEKIRAIIDSLGIKVYQDYNIDRFVRDRQNALQMVQIRKPDTPQEDPSDDIYCRLFVTSGHIDIDRDIFDNIHENGLVYNGRLIIKSNFQTTDPAIFACGRICEFSQRYKNIALGASLRLDKYNSRELGQHLSKSILENLGIIAGSLIQDSQGDIEQDLPALFMPIGIGSILPNDLLYYLVQKVECAKPKFEVFIPLLPLLMTFR